jgi:hypothetical protein
MNKLFLSYGLANARIRICRPIIGTNYVIGLTITITEI